MSTAVRRITARFSRRDLLEAAIVAVAFLLYFGVRGAVVDRPEVAYWNARDVIDAQRALGFFWEDEMNAWLADRHTFAQVMNIVYFYLHFPLIIAFGIWLYYFRRDRYTLVRDMFLASGTIALVIYWLYPVAPPRELPGLAQQYDPNAPPYILAFFDTMKEYLGYAYDTQSTSWFVNPYAAMPSLHFGWDLLLGIGIVYALWGTRWVWFALPIAVLLPISQIFSITLTANHFFLDAAAGGVVAVMGIAIALFLSKFVYPWAGAQMRQSSVPAIRWLATSGDGREPERTPA
jgi:PAP2 superfamily protein